MIDGGIMGDPVNPERSETRLDLRGVRCPHVVLRAKKALRDIPVGGVLVLECTDPLAAIDVPHFVNQTGHALAAQEKRDTLFIFRIEKRR
ncbi:MAG: sulfurtransferase TusA family protein [Pseudolabrys sp.]